MMFVGTQQIKEQKELNTRERKGQDPTEVTSAPAELCIRILWSVMPISMTALTWMVKNIPNRNIIEDFTDGAGFVTVQFLSPADKNIVPMLLMNRTDGHWTMTGSVKTIITKP